MQHKLDEFTVFGDEKCHGGGAIEFSMLGYGPSHSECRVLRRRCSERVMVVTHHANRRELFFLEPGFKATKPNGECVHLLRQRQRRLVRSPLYHCPGIRLASMPFSDVRLWREPIEGEVAGHALELASHNIGLALIDRS